MKRLLIITNRFYPQVGGAELNIFFQSLELRKNNLVDVFTPLRNKDKKKDIVKGVRIFRFKNFYNLFNKFPDLSWKAFCPTMFLKILFGKYDLIHCFPAYNINNRLALFIARKMNIPIFLTTFDLYNYSDLLYNKKKSIVEIENLKLNKKYKKFLSKFKAIFTISERETKLINSVNKNTFLSTVPINIEEYNKKLDLEIVKKKLNLNRKSNIILCLSRIEYIKGQDILIKSLCILKKKITNFIVLLVGRLDYSPKYFNDLKKLVKIHNLEKQVIFTGELLRNEILATLKICDIHVLPMRFMNSGAVIIETWASKKPVLQSNKIDPCYVIEGKNGLVFDIENPQELADKIYFLLNNTKLCKNMGINGRKLVEQKFLYTHLINKYIDQYNRFI